MPTKLSIIDMHMTAEERGGKCLSKSYGNAHTPLLWECAEGYRWNARPGNIKADTWCPTCARGKGENDEQGEAAKRNDGAPFHVLPPHILPRQKTHAKKESQEKSEKMLR